MKKLFFTYADYLWEKWRIMTMTPKTLKTTLMSKELLSEKLARVKVHLDKYSCQRIFTSKRVLWNFENWASYNRLQGKCKMSFLSHLIQILYHKAVASFIFVSHPPVIEKPTLPPFKKKQGSEKKTNLMYDNQYEKYVKTLSFIVAGWDSAYFNTYLLLLGYIIAENPSNFKKKFNLKLARWKNDKNDGVLFPNLVCFFLKIGRKPTLPGMRNKNKNCGSLRMISFSHMQMLCIRIS